MAYLLGQIDEAARWRHTHNAQLYIKKRTCATTETVFRRSATAKILDECKEQHRGAPDIAYIKYCRDFSIGVFLALSTAGLLPHEKWPLKFLVGACNTLIRTVHVKATEDVWVVAKPRI
jgi:hypothetical protein